MREKYYLNLKAPHKQIFFFFIIGQNEILYLSLLYFLDQFKITNRQQITQWHQALF